MARFNRAGATIFDGPDERGITASLAAVRVIDTDPENKCFPTPTNEEFSFGSRRRRKDKVSNERPLTTLGRRCDGLPDMANRMLMAAMSRPAPLIVRRVGPRGAALPFEEAEPFAGTDAAAWLDDLRLFATG